MELDVTHNLTPEELSKALHGLAEAEGISEELVKALKKTSACDLTPKKPKDKAIRQIYDMLTAEFAKAAADVQMYADHLLTLKKSQLAFDFNAPLHLEATTDKTGHVVHRWMVDHHSTATPSHKQEAANMKPTIPEMAKRIKADDYDLNEDTGTEYREGQCDSCGKTDDQLQEVFNTRGTTEMYGHVCPGCIAAAHEMAASSDSTVVEQPQEAAVMTNLKEQLEAYKDKLQAQYIDSVTSTLGWLQRLYGQNLREKNENTSLRNSKHYKVLENIGGSTYMDTDGNYHIDQAAAADKGREYADATIAAWHDKITGKIKDLQNSTVHQLDGNRFIITGERDGKKITIDQDMIINRSANGTMFNQFPARIYVDGKFHSEAAYKKLTGDDAIEKQAKAVKDAEKRAKNMLPSGIFAKGDKVKLKLKRGEERYETEGTVLTERNGKTVVRYGANRFNMRDMGIETEKLARWNDKGDI